MAKIIGNALRDIFEARFLGKKITCPRDNTIMEIDEEEYPSFGLYGVGYDVSNKDAQAYGFKCPVCNHIVNEGDDHNLR